MKIARILIIVLAVLCLLATVASFVSATRLDFAKDHYDVTKERNDWWYGCNRYDCEYCRGRGRAEGLNEFAYYRHLVCVKNIAVSVAIISGVATLGTGVFILMNKKKRNITS